MTPENDGDARAKTMTMTSTSTSAADDCARSTTTTTTTTTRARLPPRRALDFVTFDANNAYGQAFKDSDIAHKLAHDPMFDGWSRKRGLKKEITEAYAALRAVRGALEDADGGGDGGENLIFVELCSGRGFVSIVLASEFPKSRVFMIDNDTKMNVDHVKAFDERMTFHALDIHDAATEAFIRDLASKDRTKTVVIVGIHLCGILSHRAIELYERISEVSCLVVSPCCLPQRRRHDVFGVWCTSIARSVKHTTPYNVWCTQLLFRIPRTHRRNMLVDHDMLCEQNTLLIASKGALDRASLDWSNQTFVVPGRTCATWRTSAKSS
jgi:hypothetical protein